MKPITGYGIIYVFQILFQGASLLPRRKKAVLSIAERIAAGESDLEALTE